MRIMEFTRDEFVRSNGEVTIVSGGAKGVDTLAVEAAEDCGLKFEEIKPDFGAGYSKSAYAVRNSQIVDSADMVIAFWDGYSAGTRMVIDMCLSRKKHLEVIFDD